MRNWLPPSRIRPSDLQPRFETLTYGETWARVRAPAQALIDDPFRPADWVATLGFTSVDCAIVDMFTRPMLSLALTGNSFYELDEGGSRQRADFDVLPVEFIADAISTIGAEVLDGFETYYVMSPAGAATAGLAAAADPQLPAAAGTPDR